jgi:hypothetical protein
MTTISIDATTVPVERTTTLIERRGAFHRSWTVTSRYQGARIDSDGNVHTTESGAAVFDARNGWEPGPEIQTEFTFDESYSDDDQKRIQEAWQAGERDRWTVEEDYIKIEQGVEFGAE